MGGLDLLFFNPNTGTLALKESKSYSWNRPYGLEFSLSGRYLYVASRFLARNMVRYDPSLPAGSVFPIPVPSGTIPWAAPFARFGQIQSLDNDAVYSPLVGSNQLIYIPFSSTVAASFSTPLTKIGLAAFYWGLPNYWRG
jgi:hypothetical protein